MGTVVQLLLWSSKKVEKGSTLGLRVGQLLLQKLDVLLTFTQQIRGARNIHEGRWLGQRTKGAYRNQEMRVYRIAASAIDARFDGPEAAGRMKCERLDPILQHQSHILEHAGGFFHEFPCFAL